MKKRPQFEGTTNNNAITAEKVIEKYSDKFDISVTKEFSYKPEKDVVIKECSNTLCKNVVTKECSDSLVERVTKECNNTHGSVNNFDYYKGRGESTTKNESPLSDRNNSGETLPRSHVSSGDSQLGVWRAFKTWFRGLCPCGRKREGCKGKLASWRSFRKDYFGNVPVAIGTPDVSRINSMHNIFSMESQIYDSGSPPPYSLHPGEMDLDYSLYNERLQDPSSFCSMETGGSSDHRFDRGETPWCKILYWEQNERKGNVFPVLDPAINVLGDTPHGSGLSLASFFGGPPKDERIRRTRKKICQGLVLWREGKVVWVYNRSEAPVYLNSASLDGSFFNLNLYKCPPGYAMIIYYYEMANALMGRPDYAKHFQDKADVNSVRISFAKGWGKNYHRREILCCPCWIEVHVVPTLKVEQLTPHR